MFNKNDKESAEVNPKINSGDENDSAKRTVPPKRKKRAALSKIQRTLIAVASCVLAAVILFTGSVFLFPAFYFGNATAITINGMKVPVYEYNFNYWTTVQTFFQTNASRYESSLDTTKDLGKQQCPTTLTGGKNMTWKDYFLGQTDAHVEKIVLYYQKAVEAGYTLSAENQKAIDDYFGKSIKKYADDNNISVEDFIRSMFGSSCNEKNLRIALEHYTLAAQYETYLLDSYTVEQTELDNWMTQYKDQFWGACYRYYGFAAASDSEEDIKLAKKKAHEFIGKVTDQASFASLAYQTAADKEKTKFESDGATLRYYFTVDEISDADISNWLFDTSRKSGDKEVIYSVADGTAYALLFVDANYPPSLAANLYSIYFGIGGKYADDSAAQAAAQEAQNNFIESGKTVEAFKGLAAQYSDDVNATQDGGLTSNFLPKNMDQEVAIWCYTTGRNLGEYSIIKKSDSSGYFFVYLESWGEPVWKETAISDIKEKHYTETVDELFKNVQTKSTFLKSFMVSK